MTRRTARSDSALVRAFRDAIEQRRVLLAAGATPAAANQAIEDTLRVALGTPADEWPGWAQTPRCGSCRGSGLLIQTVKNRLGILVDEGRPCHCQTGNRYRKKAPVAADFTAAGKTMPKPKGFQRWHE
jgi:hypothetical protein